jgi:hypothetical protein
MNTNEIGYADETAPHHTSRGYRVELRFAGEHEWHRAGAWATRGRAEKGIRSMATDPASPGLVGASWRIRKVSW